MEDGYKAILEDKVREESFIGVVPKIANDLKFDLLKERLNKSNLFSVLEIIEEVSEESMESLKVKINYLDNEYEIEVRIFEMTDLLRNTIKNYNMLSGGYFESYMDNIKQSDKMIMTKMVFENVPIEAYHLQLKVLYTLSYDNYLLVDISAYKLLEGEHLEMIAQSNIPPTPNIMYSTHYIPEKGIAWLHTHGVRRFGSVEFEFLNIDDKMAGDYNKVLNTVVVNAIVDGPKKEEEEMVIGYSNNTELKFSWLRWEYAVEVLAAKGLFGKKKPFIGDLKDRVQENGDQDEHARPSGAILALINGNLKSPNEYKNNFGDNLMLYYSTNETIRMSMFAKENYYYFQNIFNNHKNVDGWSFLVKIACKYKDGTDDKYEHMWFAAESIDDDNIRGKLINQPYFAEDLKNGEIYDRKIEDMSDWIIYTPNMTIDANNVYLYNKIYNSGNTGRSS